MPTFKPYSARLARGTVPMFHSRTTSLRYMRMERVVNMEALGMLSAAAFVGTVGWMGGEGIVLMVGTLALLLGGMVWMLRRLMVRYRRQRTPGMIFISDEGIDAILPDSRTCFLRWEGLRARTFRLKRGGIPDNIYLIDTAMVGIRLKDGNGRRIYVTHDLDGYKELLEILVELAIPIAASHDPILGTRGGLTTWRRTLERRTWEERN